MSFTHTPSDADNATHFYGANATAWLRVVKPDQINTLCEQNFANPLAVLMIDDPTQQPTDLTLAQAWLGVAIHRAAFCDLEHEGGWVPNHGTVAKAFEFMKSSMRSGKSIIICSGENKNIATAFLLAAKAYDRQSRGQERPVGQSIQEIMAADPMAAPNLRTLQLICTQHLSFARHTIVKSCFEHTGILANLVAAASARADWLAAKPGNAELKSHTVSSSACHSVLKRRLKSLSYSHEHKETVKAAAAALLKRLPTKKVPPAKPLSIVIKKPAAQETLDPRSRAARSLARAATITR